MASRPKFALFAVAACLTGGFAVGCADTLTFSKSEQARGRIALGEGDHETAASVFADQVRQNPRDYRSHLHLGQARMAAGNETAALRSYRTALEVMPTTLAGENDDEYRALIVDEYARALAAVDVDGTMVDELAARAKGDVTRQLVVARAHAEAGRPDAAIDAYRAARTLDKNDQLAAKDFGLYLESIRQNDAAEDVLRRAYVLDTRDSEVAAGLRRLGVVPGPAILSRNDLAKPAIPLGPLPTVKLHDPEGDPGRPAPSYTGDLN